MKINRNRLIQDYHIEIDDPIVEMCSTCTICKKLFNPYWDIKEN